MTAGRVGGSLFTEGECGMRDIYNEKGLTLVEVLFAVIILAVALIPMLTMFTTSERFNAGARKMSTAVNLAQGRLEELKNTPFRDIADVTPATPFPSPHAAYRYAVDVDQAGDLKTVTVAVYYREGETDRQVALVMDRRRR